MPTQSRTTTTTRELEYGEDGQIVKETVTTVEVDES